MAKKTEEVVVEETVAKKPSTRKTTKKEETVRKYEIDSISAFILSMIFVK